MTINEHISTFAGLPVRAFDPHTDPPRDPSRFAWRVDTDYDGAEELFELRLSAFLESAWVGQVRALIIGQWGEAYENPAPVARLVAAADRLTGLRALFLGEMILEESEISWILQDDVTPVLVAYPELEVLTIRGSQGLGLKPVRHERLRELTIQTGGLPAEIVRAVGDCELPALTHLELWLGTSNYGGDANVEDFAQILTGGRLPALTYLGLRNAELADQVAAAVAGAPVLARLKTLDLSLGLLSDVGATALLAGQPLTHLSLLNLEHHYLSEPVQDRLNAELVPMGVTVDLSDGGDPDNEEDRYIHVAE